MPRRTMRPRGMDAALVQCRAPHDVAFPLSIIKENFMRRGSVLIVVLVMTAFILSVVMMTFEKSADTYAGVVGVQAENQGGIYVSSIATAIKTLMALDNADFDGVNDEWTVIPTIPVEGGYVSVQLKVADDRIPVNALTQPRDSAGYTRVVTAFDKLFTELELDSMLWHGIHDWVRPADNEPPLILTPAERYNPEGNGYTAKHKPLESLAELRLVPNIAREYNRLSNFLCMGGETTPHININFAPPEVISAFLPELESYVDQIVELRAEEPFQNKDALYTIMSDRTAYTAILPYFDVKSSLFYAKVELNLAAENYYYHILFRRNGTSMNVAAYIEGRPINYF
ncbi:MAG: general secretion pathway protein GspK [Deferribacteraceae bacterium]|jgi:general secretion pathway protein K|nr:general secretion pathway protein GspK [Deferribacteraceae bacterium]